MVLQRIGHDIATKQQQQEFAQNSWWKDEFSQLLWVLITYGGVSHVCKEIQHIIARRTWAVNQPFTEAVKKRIKEKLQEKVDRNNRGSAEIVPDYCLGHFVNNTKLKEWETFMGWSGQERVLLKLAFNLESQISFGKAEFGSLEGVAYPRREKNFIWKPERSEFKSWFHGSPALESWEVTPLLWASCGKWV